MNRFLSIQSSCTAPQTMIEAEEVTQKLISALFPQMDSDAAK